MGASWLALMPLAPLLLLLREDAPGARLPARAGNRSRIPRRPALPPPAAPAAGPRCALATPQPPPSQTASVKPPWPLRQATNPPLDPPPTAASSLPTAIVFRENNFSPVGALHIAEAVALDTALRSLELNVASMRAAGLRAVCAAVAEHPSIERLALLGVDPRMCIDASGDDVANALVLARGLKSVEIGFDYGTTAAGSAFGFVFGEGGGRDKLAAAMDRVCRAIAANAGIAALSFACAAPFGPCEAAAVARLLGGASAATMFGGSSGSHALGVAASAASLESLSMSLTLAENDDDDEHVAAMHVLAEGLFCNSTLRHLNIAAGSIRSTNGCIRRRRAVAAVLRALVGHPAIRIIEFSCLKNSDVGVNTVNSDFDGGFDSDYDYDDDDDDSVGDAIEALLSSPHTALQNLRLAVPLTARDACRVARGPRLQRVPPRTCTDLRVARLWVMPLPVEAAAPLRGSGWFASSRTQMRRTLPQQQIVPAASHDDLRTLYTSAAAGRWWLADADVLQWFPPDDACCAEWLQPSASPSSSSSSSSVPAPSAVSTASSIPPPSPLTASPANPLPPQPQHQHQQPLPLRLRLLENALPASPDARRRAAAAAVAASRRRAAARLLAAGRALLRLVVAGRATDVVARCVMDVVVADMVGEEVEGDVGALGGRREVAVVVAAVVDRGSIGGLVGGGGGRRERDEEMEGGEDGRVDDVYEFYAACVAHANRRRHAGALLQMELIEAGVL
ncbi:hypothetical protein DFJ73DRAFT_899938 [Zopfochytrium polystomum]|nr:hypothetical protein DFJ73DRAFT_899938 [Zopfochytrium polystomum]